MPEDERKRRADRARMESQAQIALDLRTEPSYSRDDLVVADPNREAVALINRWPDWPSPYALLAGPVGSGKSHIATIWQREVGAVSLLPGSLPVDGLAAVEAGTPVLVDGLAPGGFDETALFHLMNTVRQAGSTLLMTSTTWPAAWGVATPDLLSRLKSAMTVEIHEPDEELLRAVIVKLFADRQVSIDMNVIDYLVLRIERSLATAIQTVDQLDRFALSRKSRITRQLAATILEHAETAQGTLDL